MRSICDDLDTIDLEACVDICYQDQASFFADLPQGSQCGTFQEALCEGGGFDGACDCPNEPGPEAYNIGEACADETDCRAGILEPLCYPETDPNINEPTGFAGGYCMAFNCTGSDCGPNAECYGVDPDSGLTACLDSCNPARSDCREGYDCSPNTDDPNRGACLPTPAE